MRNFILFIGMYFLTAHSYGQIVKSGLSKLPDYRILNHYGDTINLADLTKGKTAFINFWFIPCGPCFAEMSLLQKLYLKYRDNPNFIFISITKSDPQAINNMLAKSNSDTSIYPYLKEVAKMDTLLFPIYYVSSCMDTVRREKKAGYSFKMKHPNGKDCPSDIFKFSGYPTNFIVDKNGNIIYQNTGFIQSKKDREFNEWSKLIGFSLK